MKNEKVVNFLLVENGFLKAWNTAIMCKLAGLIGTAVLYPCSSRSAPAIICVILGSGKPLVANLCARKFYIKIKLSELPTMQHWVSYYIPSDFPTHCIPQTNNDKQRKLRQV